MDDGREYGAFWTAGFALVGIGFWVMALRRVLLIYTGQAAKPLLIAGGCLGVAGVVCLLLAMW